MNEQSIPGIVIALIALAGVIINAVVTNRKNRSDERSKTSDLLPPQWSDIWPRMDRMEQRLNACARVFSSLAEQWPGDSQPVLDQTDLDILEDNLPPEWRRSKRTG